MFSDRTLLTDTELLKNKKRTERIELPELQNQSTKVAVCADKRETSTSVAGSTAHAMQFLFQRTKLCGPGKIFNLSFTIPILQFYSSFSHKIHQGTPQSGGGRKNDKDSTPYRIHCVHHDTNQFCVPEVGTRYFFRSLLSLVRYLEIVLPLHAGPQLSKIW
jgi:hypothetical protein